MIRVFLCFYKKIAIRRYNLQPLSENIASKYDFKISRAFQFLHQHLITTQLTIKLNNGSKRINNYMSLQTKTAINIHLENKKLSLITLIHKISSI